MVELFRPLVRIYAGSLRFAPLPPHQTRLVTDRSFDRSGGRGFVFVGHEAKPKDEPVPLEEAPAQGRSGGVAGLIHGAGVGGI